MTCAAGPVSFGGRGGAFEIPPTDSGGLQTVADPPPAAGASGRRECPAPRGCKLEWRRCGRRGCGVGSRGGAEGIKVEGGDPRPVIRSDHEGASAGSGDFRVGGRAWRRGLAGRSSAWGKAAAAQAVRSPLPAAPMVARRPDPPVPTSFDRLRTIGCRGCGRRSCRRKGWRRWAALAAGVAWRR